MKSRSLFTKAVTMLLVIVMVIGMLPVSALAAADNTTPFTFTLSDGTELSAKENGKTSDPCGWLWDAATVMEVSVPANTASDATLTIGNIPEGYHVYKNDDTTAISASGLNLLPESEFYCITDEGFSGAYHIFFVAAESSGDAGSEPQTYTQDVNAGGVSSFTVTGQSVDSVTSDGTTYTMKLASGTAQDAAFTVNFSMDSGAKLSDSKKGAGNPQQVNGIFSALTSIEQYEMALSNGAASLTVYSYANAGTLLTGGTVFTLNFEIASATASAAAPSITTQPAAEITYKKDASSGSLRVSAAASDGGTLSYQWQESDDGTSFTKIDGATSASFAPDKSPVGVTYYRVIVTNTLNGTTAETTSSVSKVTVKENSAPSLTISQAAAAASVEKGQSYTLDLTSVFSDADGDSLSYQVKIDDAAAVSAASSYEFTPIAAGTYTLVFTANDGSATSPAYTVTLSVTAAIQATVIPTQDKAAGAQDGYVSAITIDGVAVNSDKWEVDGNNHTLNVLLDIDTADDATAAVSMTTSAQFDMLKPSLSVSNPCNVRLSDGKGTLTFTAAAPRGATRTFTIHLIRVSAHAPALATGVGATATSACVLGETYSLDLTKIFTDADGDTLTYSVNVNGAGFVAADAAYGFTPTRTGTNTLTFQANDGYNTSDATYTVTLNVTNSSTTFDVTVNVPSGIAPIFYATGGYDENAYDICGDTLSAAAGTAENGFVPYTVAVPDNLTSISYRASDSTGSLGGMSFAVTDGMSAVTLRQMNGVINTKVGGTYVTAQQADFLVRDKWNHYAAMGSTGQTDSGAAFYRYLLVAAGNNGQYTYYAEPLTDAMKATYISSSSTNWIITPDSAEPTQNIIKLSLKSAFLLTAPTGAAVQYFRQSNYYKVSEIQPEDVVENNDGTTTYSFIYGANGYGAGDSYRVSMAGKITKVGYITGAPITVTWDDDDLSPTDRQAYDTSTVYGSRGDDSLLMNVNGQGDKVMQVNDTFRMRLYRIWEVIDTDTTNIMIEPDFHYTVVSGSDVIEIDPVTTGSGNAKNNWLDITAKQSGTAIVEFSYDAMDVVSGNSESWGGAEAISSFTFNACDPARTGLVVFQVGNAATDVDFGISCKSRIGGTLPTEGTAASWDAEFDTLYFTGDSGLLTLSPSVASGSIRKVEVSGDKGVSWTALRAADGSYTAKIVTGNSLIRVTKADGTTAYQVVRGDKITVTVSNLTNPGQNLKAGDTARVTLNGVHFPIGKMSGIYNCGTNAGHKVSYTYNGSAVKTAEVYQYNFPANSYVDVVIPADAQDGSTYKLSDGYLSFNIMGVTDPSNDSANHRCLTDAGLQGSLAASASNHVRCLLPDVTLTVGDSTTKPDAPVVPGTGDDDDDGVSTDTTNLKFNLDESEIAGYVTISVEDYGVRIPGETVTYPNQLGVIIAPTKVPYCNLDTIRDVTIRLFDALGLSYNYSSVYLSAIGGFKLNGTSYPSFGEFSAGAKSGWMITLNNWFTNQGSNAFAVEDGDIIRWQYTCNYGADIHCDPENPSAEITGFHFKENYGTLSPAFSNSTTVYTYTVPEATTAIALEAIQENYWAKVTCTAGGKTYKPLQQIPVENGTAIQLSSVYTRDGADPLTDQVTLVIQYAGQAVDPLPPLKTDAVTALNAYANSDDYRSAEKALLAQYIRSGEAAIGAATSADEINTALAAAKARIDALKTDAEYQAEEAAGSTDADKIYADTGSYLSQLGTPSVGSVGGEWIVIGLARAGVSVPTGWAEGYYENAIAFVTEKINSSGQLHRVKSTENSRLILALTAISKDVTNIGGKNLLTGLANLDYVKKQGINGPIWALIAFDSYAYEIPTLSGTGTQTTRENLIATILSAQFADGGWALSGSKADPDITGMALQALAPYYNTNEAVKAAIDKALVTLSSLQNSDGGYGSWGTVNCESCAQVITALSVLDIDAKTDARFIKNGHSVLHALCSYAVTGGGFRHTSTGSLDGMATEQGYYALAAYYRMKAGKTSLYDMSDVSIADPSRDVTALIAAIGTVTADSQTSIAAARAAYDALDAAGKAKVKNDAALTAAEAAYQGICDRMDHVKSLISAIGTVEYDAAAKAKIDAARTAYDTLSDAERQYIPNYAALTAAEARYSQCKNALSVMELIAAIGTVSKDSKRKLEEARKAYDALSAQEKTLVDNYAALTAAERKFAALSPDGGTKVIGNGDTQITLDGVTYKVDAEAAELMQTISKLDKNSGAEAILGAYKTYAAMSDSRKAQVFNYEDLQALAETLAPENHRDAATGIEAEGIDWNIRLVVEEAVDGETYDLIAGSIGSSTVLKLWDIHFVDVLTGEIYQPAGTVRIKIPGLDLSKYETLRIAHCMDNRQMEYLDCTVEDGSVIFEASSFSSYALIGGSAEATAVLEDAVPENDAPEETQAAAESNAAQQTASLLWLWITLICVGVAVFAVGIFLRTRKKVKK